jgi:hypothetical protein
MPARLGVDTFVTLAGLWGLIAPKHFDDMPTTRSCGLLDPGAFELSRWRDGRCGIGRPLALLAV